MTDRAGVDGLVTRRKLPVGLRVNPAGCWTTGSWARLWRVEVSMSSTLLLVVVI
jgi:hypothetical protein